MKINKESNNKTENVPICMCIGMGIGSAVRLVIDSQNLSLMKRCDNDGQKIQI